MELVDRILALASAVGSDVKALLSNKVDKVTGKGLSTNDYTTADKNKVAALGTAASKNAQESITDTTAGRLMMVGAFGIGGLLGGARVVDCNDLPSLYPRTGFVPNLTNTGSANMPPGNAYLYILQIFYNSSNVTQVAFPYRTSYEGLWMRSRYSTSWTPWVQIYHTGNIKKSTGNDNNFPISQKAVTDALAAKFTTPAGTTSQYIRGNGSLAAFPTIPAAQVNSDWNAVSGKAQILNKPGNATTSKAGLMSADDKTKLDGLSAGIPSWTTANRPTTGAVRFGFNTDLGCPEYWDGQGWMLLTGSNIYYSSFGISNFGEEESSFSNFDEGNFLG